MNHKHCEMKIIYLILSALLFLSCSSNEIQDKSPCYSVEIDVSDSTIHRAYASGLNYFNYFHLVEIIDREPTLINQLANEELAKPYEIISKKLDINNNFLSPLYLSADEFDGLNLSFRQIKSDTELSERLYQYYYTDEEKYPDAVGVINGKKYFVPLKDISFGNYGNPKFEEIELQIDLDQDWIKNLSIESSFQLTIEYDIDKTMVLDTTLNLSGKGVNYILSLREWRDYYLN